MKVIYKGDDSAYYETKGQALLADIIHISGIYLESYKIEDLVKILDSAITFTIKEDISVDSNGIALPSTKTKDIE